MRFFNVALLVLALASVAAAAVGSPTLERLVRESERIVLARVIGVDPFKYFKGSKLIDVNARRLAEAEVTETWKGPSTRKVRYRISPGMVCDVSRGYKGEEVLLFLIREKGDVYAIKSAGRGRLPLQVVEGEVYASVISDNVVMPETLPQIPDPDPTHKRVMLVQLDALRRLVKMSQATP